MKTSRFFLAALIATIAAPFAQAKIKLPSLVGDHMVLQQEAKAQVWGWAEPGEKVTASFGGQTQSATTGPDKKWRVRFNELKAGTTGDLSIKGENEVTVKDVIVGEVWVASGQSNMEWIVQNSKDADAEKAAANWPQVRMFTLQKAAKATPQEDCVGKWEVCSPEVVGHFSAVGYFFARELHQQLKQPVGVIHTSWGGTPAEFWTPGPVLERNPAFKHYAERWDKLKADYPAAKAKFDEAMAKWKTDSEAAKAEGKPAPRPPFPPRGGDDFGGPACLWNGMIEPVLPYTIQGAIWYQGESNAGGTEAKLYRMLFPTMILSWRNAWAQDGLKGADNPEFPFLFVQLATSWRVTRSRRIVRGQCYGSRN